MNNKNVYETNEVLFIEEYADAYKKGLTLPTTKDLESKKALNKYTSWIGKLIELKPREYNKDSFEQMNQEDILEISIDIVIEIFGESFLEDFQDFFKVLIVTNENRILDGLCMHKVNKKNRDISEGFINFIPNIDVITSVVVILHEFLHYLELSRRIDLNKKRYYQEILPLYAEKYSIQYLTKISKDKDFEKKVESSRVEGIVWHFTYKIKDVEDILQVYDNAKKINDTKTIELLEHNYPFFKTSQGRQDMKNYFKCLRDSYGIGYLYADALYRKGLIDSKVLKQKLNAIFTHEETLEEVLKYYDISTRNFKIYDDNIAYLRKTIK